MKTINQFHFKLYQAFQNNSKVLHNYKLIIPAPSLQVPKGT